MTLQMICEAIRNTGFFTDIRESAYEYPIMLATHLACIALFGGMIVMTDLRILGLAMKKRPVSDVIRQLRPWKWFGFLLMISMGICLAGSKLDEYYTNPYFRIKILLLCLVAVHALIFRPTVYNRAEELDRLPVMPTRAKVAATLSLVLWTSIMCFGRLIGYYEPKTEKLTPAAASAVLHRTD